MKWWIFLAIYIAFGLAFGVVLEQPIHSMASGYFWAWSLGWPVIMAAWALKWILYVVAAIIFVLVVIGICARM